MKEMAYRKYQLFDSHTLLFSVSVSILRHIGNGPGIFADLRGIVRVT
jgi:hypothetical protein